MFLLPHRYRLITWVRPLALEWVWRTDHLRCHQLNKTTMWWVWRMTGLFICILIQILVYKYNDRLYRWLDSWAGTWDSCTSLAGYMQFAKFARKCLFGVQAIFGLYKSDPAARHVHPTPWCISTKHSANVWQCWYFQFLTISFSWFGDKTWFSKKLSFAVFTRDTFTWGKCISQ